MYGLLETKPVTPRKPLKSLKESSGGMNSVSRRSENNTRQLVEFVVQL